MVDLVRCLISELGAKVHELNNGCQPLYIAAQMGHTAVVRVLVKEFGADMNQRKEMGYLPFFKAALEGHTAVLRCMVIELGYDVNTANRVGATPCFVAAQIGNLAVLRCLVKDLGADINMAAHDGVTPLMIASNNKHTDTVRWLTKEGANTQASTSRSGTAANISKIVGASTADFVPGGQDTLLEPQLQRCGDQEVPGVQAGAKLRGAVPVRPLEGTQGKLQAVERGAQGGQVDARFYCCHGVDSEQTGGTYGIGIVAL
jgi:hypothetical protein